MLERHSWWKVSFILQVGNRRRRHTHVQRPNSHCQSEGMSFLKGIFRGVYVDGGGNMQKQHDQLTVIWKLVMISGLISGRLDGFEHS